jgi:RNA polymerase sigma-70 factor (ECF subfamily)
VSVSELLTHAGWVQALARSLVRGEDDAQDLVQETWASALRRPPQDRRNLRAWLARVLRRRRRDLRRGEVRRVAREARAARGEEAPAAEDVLLRAELRARVAQEVLRLAPPYRETVLLRFFEGLAPAEVARLHGVPVATVRTRLRRALETLRVRLRDEVEEVRLLAAPLVGAGAATSATYGTGVLMAANGKVWLGAAAALVLCGVGVWHVGRSADPQEDSSAAPVEIESTASDVGARTAPRLANAPVLPAGADAGAAVEDAGIGWHVEERDAVEPGVVAGVVRDERGRPRALVSVALRARAGGEPIVRGTAADGTFRFEGLEAGEYVLRFRWGRADVEQQVVSGMRRLEVTLRVDPPMPEGVRRVALDAAAGVLEGVVSDREGRPLATCEVRLHAEDGALLGTVATSEDGAFRFDGLADVLHGVGFVLPETDYVFVYARPGSRLAVTLGPTPAIAGVVVDATSGALLAGVPVSAARSGGAPPAAPAPAVRTGEDGRFRLVVGEGEWVVTVGVRRQGTPSDAYLLHVTAPMRGGGADLRIALERGVSLEGELRGPDGSPWTAGAYVVVLPTTPEGGTDYARVRVGRSDADGTFRIAGLTDVLCDVSVSRLHDAAEDVPYVFGRARAVRPGGRPVRIDLRHGVPVVVTLVDAAGRRLDAPRAWVQVRPSGTEPGGPEAVSALPRPGGAFHSAPLDPAVTYVVVAGGVPGYAIGEIDDVRPGAGDVVLRFPGAVFAGRLVDETGAPVVGAVVQVWSVGRVPAVHAAVETASDGTFTVPGAPEGEVEVLVLRSGTPVNVGRHRTPAEGVTLTLPR